MKPTAGTASETAGPPAVAPGVIEQDHAEHLDNIIPTRGYHMLPMVGLGGSAGSLPALTDFFRAMPTDSGMVFVVVLHLSPTHDSALAELLGRATTMPVRQATDGLKVERNHVYVIPPGKYLTSVDGHLQLDQLEGDRGKRIAVDLFFRSLADTHGPHAAAVILSGADSDGALGIKRIKERGGLTIAQDPQQAEYAGMPQASIDTGMIDWVLPVAHMPQRLIEYRDAEKRVKLPREDGPSPLPVKTPTEEEDEAALRDVLIFLRMRTGRDFTYYKRATILRRIGRRMQVNNLEELREYNDFLRTHPGEAGALLQDMLISVTNFFRDRDAFEALERHVPALFDRKTRNDAIRVWVPACATGEEAYSIAMLLLEHARKLENPPALQVFACDLDDGAIKVARAGAYPETIAADVSEERLRRFFVKDHNRYRVRRELREMVLFAAHDLLKDAPFSRMDLVSCRNLLIYLNRDAQARVFDIFHFALVPGGRLFLGSSEAIDENSPLFRVIDKRYRIYAQQALARVGVSIPMGPSGMLRMIQNEEAANAAAPVVHGKDFVQHAAVPFHSKIEMHMDRVSLADLHFRLIERLAPPSVLVSADHEVVHLSDSAGEFLKLGGGEPVLDLLRIVQPSLRAELRTALFRAAEANVNVETFDVPAELGGKQCRVDIRVTPAKEIAPGYLLVVFEKRSNPAEALAADADPVALPEPAVRHLERELQHVKLQLRDTIEQSEASTEELKASNEELQAMNEEMRSATEELETSREELQSINEELTTVNQEMKTKVEELARANSDLQNLMGATLIATVFLDRELSIKRFTPTAAEIFHMIPGDIGRPLAHLKHKLDYPDLIADAENVLRTLMPVEREVSDDGHWYQVRTQPYRTLEDHIAGVVLTLVDVTDRKRATEAVHDSEERMRMLLASARDFAIFTTDPQRRIDSWSAASEAMFGYSENEVLGQSADILFSPEDRQKGDAEREALTAEAEGRSGSERWHSRKDGTRFYGSGSVTPLRGKNGELRGFAKMIRDLTDAEDFSSARTDELTRFNRAAVGREARMVELKQEVNELCRRLKEKPRYAIPVAPLPADGSP